MGEHATLLRRGGTGGGGVGELVKLLLDERADDGLVERGDDGLVEMVIHAQGRVGVVVEHGDLLHVSDSVMESWLMSQFLSGTSKLHVLGCLAVSVTADPTTMIPPFFFSVQIETRMYMCT